jgi:hypothetical protein
MSVFPFGVAYNSFNLEGADKLLQGETQGLAFDFTHPNVYKQCKIIDTTTPANKFKGDPFSKLTYTSPSAKLCRQSDGILRHSNHNLVQQSQTFDNSFWGASVGNCSVTANSQTAPDGSLTADSLLSNGVSTNVKGLTAQVGITTVNGGVPYTMQVRVKGGLGFQWVQVGCLSSFSVWFDVTNGIVGTQTSSTGTITDLGNGWYLCSATGIIILSSTQPLIRLADSNGGSNATGTSSQGVYLWGAELKKSSVSSPTYIPTTSAAVYWLPYEWNTSAKPQGLLVEEARTNLVLRSQELTDSAWTKTAATATADVITAPDGTTTADLLTENSASTLHFMAAAASMTIVSGSTYTISCFAKANGRNTFDIEGQEGVSGNDGFRVYANLTSGAVDSTTAFGTGAVTDSSITPYANGWYRVSVTGSITGSTALKTLVVLTNPATTRSYLGDGVSGMYIWGLQCELGAFPTSYIQASQSTITRAADNINIATSTYPHSDSTGTVIVKAMVPRTPSIGTYKVALSLSNATNNERFVMYLNNAVTTVKMEFNDNGVGQAASETTATTSANVPWRAAFTYQLNNWGACLNGGIVGVDTVCTMPTNTILRIGSDFDGSLPFNGYIQNVTFLPRRVTNAEIVRLTGGNTPVGGGALLNGEEGLGIDFTYPDANNQIWIADGTTPANIFAGYPYNKLTYTAPSLKLCRQSDGIYRYGNHNRVLQSQTANNASWNNGANASVTGDTTTAPDGTQTADKIVEDTATREHYIGQTYDAGSYPHQYSVYAKPAGRSWITIQTNNGNAFFDIANGVVGTLTTGTSSITPAGNSWYRCIWQPATTANAMYITLASNNSTSSDNYTGDGTSGVFVWGAEIKRYPVQERSGLSEYIATTTTALYDLPYEWNTANVAQGILIEEARTNLAQRSQEATNAFWSIGSGTSSADATTAPDGTLTADKIIETSGATTGPFLFPVAGITTSATHVWSAFVKAAGRNFARIRAGDNGNNAEAVFNISTGVETSHTAHGTGVYIASSIVAAGNGWYRISVSGSGLATSDFAGVAAYNDAAAGSYTGDGVSGIYIWGMQIENASFPTSPIHTLGATVTRAADAISVAGASFPLSQTIGTVVVSAVCKPADATVLDRMWEIGDGTANENIATARNTGASPTTTNFFGNDGGVGQWAIASTTTIANSASFKHAGTWALNDFATSLNGDTVTIDTAGTLPTVTTLYLGYTPSAAREWGGYIKQITYLPRRATNAELQTKTT